MNIQGGMCEGMWVTHSACSLGGPGSLGNEVRWEGSPVRGMGLLQKKRQWAHQTQKVSSWTHLPVFWTGFSCPFICLSQTFGSHLWLIPIVHHPSELVSKSYRFYLNYSWVIVFQHHCCHRNQDSFSSYSWTSFGWIEHPWFLFISNILNVLLYFFSGIKDCSKKVIIA